MEKAPVSNRSLAYRLNKIDKEEDFNEQQYLEEQGLNHAYNAKFAPGNFWYNHCATTEQRAAADENYTTVCQTAIPGSMVGGAIERTYMDFEVESSPEDALFE